MRYPYEVRKEADYFDDIPDEKIPKEILQNLKVSELKDHGKTEIVNVQLPLTGLVAADTGPEVKKMMGPFGEVVVLEKPNQLVLTDTVGNLMRIADLLNNNRRIARPRAA